MLKQSKVVDQSLSLKEALKELPSLATAKFNESVDVSLHLGVDPRKMMVRGVSHMPHGLGKDVKVAVFADGEAAKEASKNGAVKVGMEDLAEHIQKEDFDFDVVIATPESMGIVGKLGKKLGPKGIMPNPKLGTVTKDVGQAVKQAIAGQAKFKLDKNGIVHCSIGKSSFTQVQLEENLIALLQTIKRLKPPASKGQYMKKLYLNTTMSKKSLRVDVVNLVK